MILGQAKKFNGRIGACRSTGSDGTLFHIEIEDKSSHARIFDAYLTSEQFGNMLMGSTEMFEANLYNTFELVNKHHQNKTIAVQLPENFKTYHDRDKFEDLLKEAVKEHEVDGWKADIDKNCNGYRLKRNNTYETIFRRYVD